MTVRITVNREKVTVDSVTVAFSTPAAAHEAMCRLREPKHVPRGGCKFLHTDQTQFDALKVAYDAA